MLFGLGLEVHSAHFGDFEQIKNYCTLSFHTLTSRERFSTRWAIRHGFSETVMTSSRDITRLPVSTKGALTALLPRKSTFPIWKHNAVITF
ncbi:hypothetical protein J6590_061068, partial [Homalodisca vitripennis]